MGIIINLGQKLGALRINFRQEQPCNYFDRFLMGILAPLLETEIGWTELEYGYIVSSFQIAYAIGTLMAGYVIAPLTCFLTLFCAEKKLPMFVRTSTIFPPCPATLRL